MITDWYATKLNLSDNFWCGPPNTKFYQNLLSHFRDETLNDSQVGRNSFYALYAKNK